MAILSLATVHEKFLFVPTFRLNKRSQKVTSNFAYTKRYI